MVADAEYPQAASTVAQKLIQRSRLLIGCLLSLLTARNLNLEHGVLNCATQKDNLEYRVTGGQQFTQGVVHHEQEQANSNTPRVVRPPGWFTTLPSVMDLGA